MKLPDDHVYEIITSDNIVGFDIYQMLVLRYAACWFGHRPHVYFFKVNVDRTENI